MSRQVIFHYHLFKNAGTSLDTAFKQNFDPKLGHWVTKEFPNNPKFNREQTNKWIVSEKNAMCFSSHTAFLPPPSIEGVDVLPVIFIRHPLDRIASAYRFERKQGGHTFGATLARNTSLAGYIESRMALANDFQCQNFHVDRFSKMYLGSDNDPLTAAKKAFDNLPFVGIVEQYNASLTKLEQLLKEKGFSNIHLPAYSSNVTNQGKSLDEKLTDLKTEIGDGLYQRLVEENQLDLAFYDFCLHKSTDTKPEASPVS